MKHLMKHLKVEEQRRYDLWGVVSIGVLRTNAYYFARQLNDERERAEKLVRLLREAADSHHNAHPEVTGWTLEKCQNGLCMERATALREWEGK